MASNVQEITSSEDFRKPTAKKDIWNCEKEVAGGRIISRSDELINFDP